MNLNEPSVKKTVIVVAVVVVVVDAVVIEKHTPFKVQTFNKLANVSLG